MEKTGEMDLYLYVDGRGRMTMPRALRCRTGMGKNSFVRVRLDGGVLRIQIDASGRVTMTGPAETIYEGETVE